MPVLVAPDTPPAPVAGAVTALVPAAPGLRAVASAPPDAAAGIPVPSAVIGWVLVADAGAVGGVRVDPVFLAAGVAWTPDQFRAVYGRGITITVGAR